MTKQASISKFGEIAKTLQNIDEYISSKNHDGNKFESIGFAMEATNNSFYRSGIQLGSMGFKTLATEKTTLEKLAMSYLSMIFIGWYPKKKDEYNILEIGSGSGDLMLKIFNIRDQVLSDEASLDIHKKFFESLRFNIVDFKEMTDVQIEKLGHLRASQVKFLNLDIAKDLLPTESFDFIYGNEIPDTQRLEFLEVETIKTTGEKKFFLRAIKTDKNGDKTEVKVNLANSLNLISQINQNLYPITDLNEGLYKLQFGFHALIHNIQQATTKNCNFVLTDYFNMFEDLCSSDLRFAGLKGARKEDKLSLDKTTEPGKQLIIAQKLYNKCMDVTYSPDIGADTEKMFDACVSSFDVYDTLMSAFLKFRINSSDLKSIYEDPLFGKIIKQLILNTRIFNQGIMKKELSPSMTPSTCVERSLDDREFAVRFGFGNQR